MPVGFIDAPITALFAKRVLFEEDACEVLEGQDCQTTYVMVKFDDPTLSHITTLPWSWIASSAYLARRYGNPSEESPMLRQVGGQHYKQSVIQPVEFTMGNAWDHCASDMLAYLFRWRSKGGIKDLKKARHFAEIRHSLISRRHVISRANPSFAISMNQFVSFNKISAFDDLPLYALESWVGGGGSAGFEMLTEIIDQMIAHEGNVQ